MRKIRNPFIDLKEYTCFGCSPDNPKGLQMTFSEDGDEIVSYWTPQPQFSGFHRVLHGGIQATLMDEIASWVIYVKLMTAGVTSRVELKYSKTVYTNKGTLQLRARVLQVRRNLADITVRLMDAEGQLCTEGFFTFFTFHQKKAKEKLYLPDHSEFFEKDG